MLQLPCTHFTAGDNVPSASTYTLPMLLGSKVPNKQSSASFSMAGRPITGSFDEDLAKTPGPGRYDSVHPNQYANKAPLYSMLGKRYMPGGKIRVHAYKTTTCLKTG